MKTKLNTTGLRPPTKRTPAPRIRGEKHQFFDSSLRNLTPPRTHCTREGPETTSHISLRNQATRILQDHHTQTPDPEDQDALIDALVQWRLQSK